ncbi:MAG: AsmA-like C-terminal region-containing protein, partial [Bacteroidota bacterium]
EMLLDSVTLIQRLTLRKKPMVIKTTLAFSDDLKKIKVEPSRYTFDHAHFEGQGNIDTEGDGYIDMIFKGDDEGFSVSNLFLTNSGVENIEKGNLFFEGTVKGKLFKGRPSFEGSFGIDGLQVQIHNTNRRIRNLNLKGSYHSGEKKDFSDAWLNVSKFNAILPDGKLDCKLKIENMAEPWVDLDFYLKANVTDFDKVFELENVKNMSGKLEVSTAYIGQLVVKDNTIENFNGQASLYFDKVALKSQQGNDLKQITGGVVLRDSTLIFDYLNVFYEKSNFKLNGSVTNTSPIILDAIKKLNETSTSENKKVNQEYHVSQFDIDCFMAIEAGDFEEELRKAGLDSLTGSIELTTNLKGDFNWQSSGLENYTGRTSLSFNEVSFNINEVGEVKEIDGEILLEDEDLLFKGFKTVFGNSDFLINGELKNTMAVLLDEEKTIDGTLNIKSDMFDFPDMFAWNQKTAKGFPFQTKNLDLTVSPKTTTEQLHNFVKIPEIEFTINKLEAEILELTPPVTVQSGVFTLADRDSVVYLDFSDFNIDLPEGNLLANVRFNPPVGIHKRLKIDVDLKNANPVKDLAPFLPDTVPEELSGVLNAKLNLDLLFSKNPKGFKKIELTSDEMSFVNSTDTLDLKGLQLKAEDFYYTSGENALKTLSFNAGISFRNLIANNIHTSKLNYSVETIDGVFRVVSNKSPLFDGQGFGLFVLRPFDDVPSYEFNYKMDQFDVSHLLETFNRENVIDGKMDFDLYLTISGNTKEELLKSMDGHLKIYGQHIILYGIDLDKLIERFERTQRFTIADVGFGLVLGPAGLLLSKGTNYTRMAIKNKDQTSEINEFLTDYKINNGIMKLEDVALATKRSRLAAKGSVDLNSEQLDLTIAVLNRSGCSLFSQVVGGSVGEPERGKAKVAKVLLAPITNLAKPIKCKPFYEGKVKDPRVKK